MTITVFGATGMVGKYVVQQALAAGHRLIAFGRNIDKLIDTDLNDNNFKAIKGYVFDEDDVFKALQHSEAVVSVLGGALDGADKTRSLGIKNIIAQMQKNRMKRIIGVGGMGVLNADATTLNIDLPGYPQTYLPVGYEHLQAYKYLQSSNLDWTFVCPPTITDSAANHKYVTQVSYHPSQGKQEVSAGNIADFILTELTEGNYIHQRVGIADEP